MEHYFFTNSYISNICISVIPEKLVLVKTGNGNLNLILDTRLRGYDIHPPEFPPKADLHQARYPAKAGGYDNRGRNDIGREIKCR